MFWVVVTVLLSLCVTGGLIYSFMTKEIGGFGVAALAFLLFVVLTIFCSFTKISTGEMGLVYSFSGKLSDHPLTSPGIVTKAPWTHIVKVNVQLQREEFDLGEGNSAVSKDQQPIFAHLALNYELDPSHVPSLYRDVGPNWKAKLIDSRVLQDFKEITATYPTIEITQNREQLRRETRERLKQELARYAITVRDLFVQNLGFSKAYTNAIEAKQVQVQAAARAQAKVAQVQAEARQRVAQAEGERDANIAEAQGQAKANRLIAASITDRLIELKRTEALSKATTIYVPANWTAFGNLGK